MKYSQIEVNSEVVLGVQSINLSEYFIKDDN